MNVRPKNSTLLGTMQTNTVQQSYTMLYAFARLAQCAFNRATAAGSFPTSPEVNDSGAYPRPGRSRKKMTANQENLPLASYGKLRQTREKYSTIENTLMLRTITATRYVTPLREGGSLPAIVETDDDGLYVLKFRGSGHGPQALIAELVAGEIARALGLPVPEIVFIELDPVLGRSEPDFEIQALVRASPGLNLALDFLPGSVAFDAIDAQS